MQTEKLYCYFIDHLTLESGEDYLNILAGIFVMQDVQIGLVMGILPILAGHFEQSKTSFVILPNQGVIHYWLHGASHAGSKGLFILLIRIFCFTNCTVNFFRIKRSYAYISFYLSIFYLVQI